MAQLHQSRFDALGGKLQEEVEFLEHIYKSAGKNTKIKAALQTASTKQLVLLVTILYHICNGDIKVSKATNNKIARSKKRPFICRHFERDRDVAELKRGGREKILPLLFKLQSVLPVALDPLFS